MWIWNFFLFEYVLGDKKLTIPRLLAWWSIILPTPPPPPPPPHRDIIYVFEDPLKVYYDMDSGKSITFSFVSRMIFQCFSMTHPIFVCFGNLHRSCWFNCRLVKVANQSYCENEIYTYGECISHRIKCCSGKWKTVDWCGQSPDKLVSYIM